MTHRNLVAERIDDSFDTFDEDVWLLRGSAVFRNGRVRLTPATNSTTGALEWRDEFDTNVWELRFRFDIENGSSDPADEVSISWYNDGIDGDGYSPLGGYQVSFDHFDDEIRLDSFIDGEQKTLDSTAVTVPDGDEKNIGRVKYTRGTVVVSMNGNRYIEHEIEDPTVSGTEFFFSARTGGEDAAHYVDEVRLTASTKRNIKTAQSEWPTPGIDISNKTNTYKLVRALVSVLDEEDQQLDQIRRSHHINTAVDEELERLGSLVQLDRNQGESDKKYRARIKVQYRVGNIGTTFDEFSQFASALLSTSITNIEFVSDLAANPATAAVSAPPEVYDNVELTRQEVAEFLGEAVPAGHDVNVLESGTFRLKADSDVDDPDKGLTSDSISTGGTLAADIV